MPDKDKGQEVLIRELLQADVIWLAKHCVLKNTYLKNAFKVKKVTMCNNLPSGMI